MTNIYSAKSIGPIEAQARAAALECRRRLMEARPAAPRLTLVKPAEAAPETAQRAPVAFDHHVLAYKAQTSGTAYVLFECLERNLMLYDVQRPNRTRKMVMLRGELSYALRTKFKWTYPQIGKFFQRDHTSILSCVDVYCAATGADRPPRQLRVVTAEQMADIKRRFLAGVSISKAARACNLTPKAAIKAAQKEGWYVARGFTNAKRHLLPIEEIGSDYCSSMLVREIQAKYGISRNLIGRLANDNGWPRRHAGAKKATIKRADRILPA